MVRYIRDDELYHSDDELYHYGRSKADGAPGVGTGNWRRSGSRLYKYSDGSYTPLGRLHYGIGVNKKDMTPGERMLEAARAARDTAAGYGLVKYKQTTKVIKGDRFAKARAMKQQKADQKRAEEAYKKRQELKVKAQEEKEKLKKIYAEKKKEQEEKFRKEQEENAKKNKELKEKQDEAFKKQMDEVNQKRSESNVDEAKSGKFDKFSNDDLRKYTERAQLEAAANKAELEARLAKMSIPVNIIKQIASYGDAGVDAFNSYRRIMGTINDYKASKVPVKDTPVQAAAKDIMKDFSKLYNTGALKDPDTAMQMREELAKQMQMIDAAAKIFAATKENYKPER